MKNIIGFSIGDEVMETAEEAQNASVPDTCEEIPVKSLVTVRFPGDGRSLTYYNDKFALKCGDSVYVNGKMAGKLGEVESVTTKFKICLSDYKKVIARVRMELHGTYEHIIDKMVCFGAEAPDADTFRGWVIPPRDEEEEPPEIIVGDGYSFELDELEQCEDIQARIVERAFEYCNNGSIMYLSVKNGVGTAFVCGTKNYEVNFRIDGRTITDLYCDCPFPGFCKHSLAVMITLRGLLGEFPEDSDDFVAIDETLFYTIIRKNTDKITL